MTGSCICTEDGTYIVIDPKHGTGRGRTREEAIREIERRKQARHKPAKVEFWTPWSVAKAVFG